MKQEGSMSTLRTVSKPFMIIPMSIRGFMSHLLSILVMTPVEVFLYSNFVKIAVGWLALILASDQPYTMTSSLIVSNTGNAPLTYTVTISGFENIPPTLTGDQFLVITGNESGSLNLAVTASSLLTGTYAGNVTVAVEPLN